MPIRPPVLDDRRFDDLVAEVLSRVPAHTPEWTNPRLGDPGRTLVELFAWLTDTLLYRVNRIPERQKLAFLRLLGQQMRPAVAARGIVSISFDDKNATGAVTLRPYATLAGPVPFETRGELTVLPIEAQAYYKRRLTGEEEEQMAPLVEELGQLYGIGDRPPVPYVTEPVFPAGAADPHGFDVIQRTVDSCLWLALFAAKPQQVNALRDTLGGAGDAPQRLLSVGVAPSVDVPALDEEIGPRAGIPHVWEMSTGRVVNDVPEYLTLDVLDDTGKQLTRPGVVRLALPAPQDIGALPNDVRRSLEAGMGDRPPRIDDPEQAARLVTWLRLRPTLGLHRLALGWIGINAVEIDQRQTITARVVGQSEGTADQEMSLAATSVERETLELQVEEADTGYQLWQRTDDLATAGRDDAVYELDGEAGTVRFGDGVRGRIPALGRRVRVARMRAGGGAAGNLPAGTLAKVAAVDLGGRAVARLKVQQSLPTRGGADAETLEQAERRIPAAIWHRERAVTAEDYQRLAADTPGVHLGRVEVLPRFKPHQRRFDVPGVVSVMVLPHQEMRQPPNPRPDRPLLEGVHAYLGERRPLTTELYVIGCEYVPLAVSATLTVRDGFARDAVIHAAREAVRRYLWSLPPGGPEEEGWPLGRPVRDRELEVVIARVPGVSTVPGVNLFQRQNETWRLMPRAHPEAPQELTLLGWQLPELLSLLFVADEAEPPTQMRGAPGPFGPPRAEPGGGEQPGGVPGGGGVAIPVVPEVC